MPVPARFSGAIRGDARGVTVSYCGNSGSAGAPESQAPQRYPTSRRTFRRLRVCVLENTFEVVLPVTLCRNGGEPTALQVVVPAGAIAGQKYVRDVPPIRFEDGEDYDVQLTVNGDGAAKISVSVE